MKYSKPHFVCLVLILAVSIATLAIVIKTSKAEPVMCTPVAAAE